MKVYELEVETPTGVTASKFYVSNLVARYELDVTQCGLNTLRLWRHGFSLQPKEVLLKWANGIPFREQPTQRELLATKYPKET